MKPVTSPRSLLTDDSEDDVSELDLSTGNKDTFILEVEFHEQTKIILLTTKH
jgi:hypothetical protein